MTDTPMSAKERAHRLVVAQSVNSKSRHIGLAAKAIRQAEAAARKAALEEAGKRVCLVCERRVRALFEKPQ